VIVQIFGAGIAGCSELKTVVAGAVATLGIKDVEIHSIDDPAMMVARSIWRAPALAIDGKVVVRGRLPSAEEVTALLKAAAER
jgi:small redox-active disulfide protein 2